MKNFLTSFFVLIIVSSTAIAQNVSLSGRVQSDSDESLIGATILLESPSGEFVAGASADQNGLFRLSAPQGDYQLTVSYVGYVTYDQPLTLQEDLSLTIILEENDLVLREVVVTTQKRAQSNIDVPVAVSNVSAEFISEANLESFAALSDYVPGVQVQEQVVILPGYVIRGITSDNSSLAVENRVSVFQDNISISKAISAYVEFFDIDRVEVVKGPHGTLFGRAAQIGAIQIITKRPTARTGGNITLGLGNYGQEYLQATFNAPLIEDKLFGRASIVYNQRDGYVENLAGGDLQGKNTFAARLSYRYIPNDQLVADLILNYQKDDTPGTSFKSGVFAPTGGTLDASDPAAMESGDDLRAFRDVFGLTFNVSAELTDQLTLTSNTGFRQLTGGEVFDADGTLAKLILIGGSSDYAQFSQELRLNLGSERVSVAVGASYFTDNGESSYTLYSDDRSFFALSAGLGVINSGQPNYSFCFPSPDQCALLGPTGPVVNPFTGDFIYMNPNVEENFTDGADNSSFDLFADIEVDVTDFLSVGLGYRKTWESLETMYYRPSPQPQNASILTPTGRLITPIPTADRLYASDDFDASLYRATVKIKPNDAFSVYGTVSTGRRPYIIQFNSAAAPETLDDENVRSYEAGLKAFALDSRLEFNASLFAYEWTNFITDLPDGLLFEVTDVGSASALGFEAELRALIAPFMAVYGNYAYMDATFDDEDSDGQPQAYAGNTFRLTPEHSGAVGVRFFADTETFQFVLNPNVSFKSQHYFDDNNDRLFMNELGQTFALEEDGYNLANLTASLTLKEQGVTFSFFANNLFDETYLLDAGNTGGSVGLPTLVAGPRRFVGTKVNFEF
jgi:iron complex outermembrane recepter protein